MKKGLFGFNLFRIISKYPKNRNKDPFVTIKNSKILRETLYPGILYIQYSLYPVCVKSGVDCVIVEEDSFTAQM